MGRKKRPRIKREVAIIYCGCVMGRGRKESTAEPKMDIEKEISERDAKEQIKKYDEKSIEAG